MLSVDRAIWQVRAMLIRKASAALLVLLALVACLLAMGNRAGIDHTIEHSLRLDSQFRIAADAIEGFRKSHGRLPNAEERSAVLPPDSLGHYEVWMAPSGFAQCDRDAAKYGHLAGSDYVLIAWRGEWWECYAPTRHMSTLLVEPAAYTMFGAVWLDTVAFMAFA
ncbi:MAG: hypothetical protein WA957_09475, partial [Alteraurantiacibacter sp.]